MNYKTNVMRILDANNITYQKYDYSNTNAINGLEVATTLNQDPNKVFKTIVTISNTNNYYVFMLPVNKELDFKKCAIAVNEKSISMLKSSLLLNLTGYIHGGCSPIGMKHLYPTIIDSSGANYTTIIFSAGKIGYQVELSLDDLAKIIKYNLSNITN